VFSAVAPGARAPSAPESFIGRLTGARSEAWRASARLVAAKPVLGYGFGVGDRLFSRYPEKADFSFFQGDNPNNAYVQLVTELGIVGGLLFVLPLALALHAGFRVLRDVDGWAPQAAFPVVLFVGCVAALVESILTSAGAPWELLIWSAAALSLAYPRPVPGIAYAVRPRLRRPAWRLPVRSRTVLAAGLATAAVVAAVALALTGGGRAPATVKEETQRAAHLLARRECGATRCDVSPLTRIQGSFWLMSVRSRGRKPSCYVVDLRRFGVDGETAGAAKPAACASPPLARAYALGVAVFSPSPPYFVPPADDPRGLEPAIVNALANRLGIALVTWRDAPTPRVPPKTDFVVHAFYRGFRLPRNDVAYLPIPQELVALRGMPAAKVRTARAAAALRIGVIDSEGKLVVHRIGARRTTLYSSLGDAVAALNDRAVDALVLNLGNATGVVAQSSKVVGVARFPPHFFYVMRFPEHSRLRPLVARELAAMSRDGTLQKLQALIGRVPVLPVLR
jgi:ABC-type amino acid transport substrate-binding protein